MNTVNEEVYDGDLKSFFPPIEHEFIVDRAVALILEGIKFCFDLTIKLLVNKTAIPFILGDNPTVYYNQYLEKKKWPHSKCGWSTIGLQIFLPISPNITIMMYDDLFYRIGKHKSHIVDIEEVADVNSLNLLQILNCTSNVYFNENVSEGYITRLLQKSLRFPKPNQLRTSVKKLAVNDKIQEGDVIGFGKTDCEIGLDLKWIKPTAHNLNFVLGSRGLYMRPHPSILMNEAMKTMGPHLFNPDSAGENL